VQLPNVADARLPATYERACSALATCDRIDECKDWADKAAALASYAKQADDRTLYRLAVRIQSRAIRRAGELLEDFDGRGRPAKIPTASAVISQQDAAAAAGLSERQQLTAVRVANVPAADFEAAIESDTPPTITELAARGTNSRPGAPAKFREATHVIGVLEELARFCAEHDASIVASAVMPHEKASIHDHIEAVEDWLHVFLFSLFPGGVDAYEVHRDRITRRDSAGDSIVARQSTDRASAMDHAQNLPVACRGLESRRRKNGRA